MTKANDPYYPTDAKNCYKGADLLTVIASQQMAALSGTLRESTNITPELAAHIAKESVILAKALINELNSEQDNGK